MNRIFEKLNPIERDICTRDWYVFSLIFFTFYLVALSHWFEPCMAHSICWAYFGGPLNVFLKVGLEKFDIIHEHDTNSIRFLWVLVKYNRVCVVFVLICLTCLINKSYSC